MNPKRTKYLERRQRLLDDLGNRCAKCSATNLLQFDCIIAAGPEHHSKSQYDRMLFYEREHVRGNLQILCQSCHQEKSKADKLLTQWQRTCQQLAREQAANAPFTASTEEFAAKLVARGPEPPVSDWTDWCRWHRGEPAK